MRRFLALAALFCIILAGCESTAAPKEKSHFDIFAYYSILSELATPESLQKMADAGITISYMSYGSIEENLKVLDAAKEMRGTGQLVLLAHRREARHPYNGSQGPPRPRGL